MKDGFRFGTGETILVIGLGRSGLACIEVLRELGVTVFATDDQPRERIRDAVSAAEALGARFFEAAGVDAVVSRLGSAVLSPGVPPTSPVARRLYDANVPVLGEIELAYRLCKAPIVAVTGTKGKSTTTALIGHLLRGCGLTVRVGGNIGNPLIKEVRGASADSWIVAEVSSFQLETIRAFKPRVAVLLNISPDHLDRYHSMDEYAEAKYRIGANQALTDFFVGNLDDPMVSMLHWRRGDTRLQARQLWFSLRGDDEATMYVRNGVLTYAPVAGDPRPIAIMPAGEIPLLGEHNRENAMAALLAALAIGCRPEALRAAMATFVPMSHRLEVVADVDGVRYVDDSKATNPAAVVAALHAYDRPIVLIAGGRSKGSNFEALGAEIRHRVKALIVIGESAAALRASAGEVEAVEAFSMEEAVQHARRLARDGDVVLLSPGCASFDMFSSADDRGERFAAAVAALREPAGA
ncbi:MAG: UDP-N-acetylmuramoyl-L-alanine--D-glutamate ligase [Candidatus Eremiobacteraeota bacterium]|nr:UDP-N-acetylmuramoyl-L-alanine--D-glutamate ligase [Candidatus Eremiobacteraeota bacterium]